MMIVSKRKNSLEMSLCDEVLVRMVRHQDVVTPRGWGAEGGGSGGAVSSTSPLGLFSRCYLLDPGVSP